MLAAATAEQVDLSVKTGVTPDTSVATSPAVAATDISTSPQEDLQSAQTQVGTSMTSLSDVAVAAVVRWTACLPAHSVDATLSGSAPH